MKHEIKIRNLRELVEDKISSGVAYGLRRVYKHKDHVISDDEWNEIIEQCTMHAVMELDDLIDWDPDLDRTV